MSRIRDTVLLIGLLLAIALIVAKVTGCLPREAKEAAAEATYLGQQLECVDNLETKEDMEGCRESVRRRWGIHATVHDAGTVSKDASASTHRLPPYSPEWLAYDALIGGKQ